MTKVIIKIAKYISLVAFFSLFQINYARAFCPICTVAAAGGVGLSRWLGIDDLITGLWIGALIISTTMWIINWLTKKGLKSVIYKIIIFVVLVALAVIPLYRFEIIGHPMNRVWGIDKLALGMGAGFVLFWIFEYISILFKNKRGKLYIPFQKVIIPVALLAIVSLIVYFIIK